MLIIYSYICSLSYNNSQVLMYCNSEYNIIFGKCKKWKKLSASFALNFLHHTAAVGFPAENTLTAPLVSQVQINTLTVMAELLHLYLLCLRCYILTFPSLHNKNRKTSPHIHPPGMRPEETVQVEKKEL